MKQLAADRPLQAGTVRVYGALSDDDDHRLLLRDRETGRTYWVQSTTGPVRPGVVLDCLVEGADERRLVASRARTETTLAIGVADGLGQPARTLWASRPDDSRRAETVIDPPGQTPPTEVHVTTHRTDPERFRRRLLAGEVSFEPWFESLPTLASGGTHVTVVLRAGTTTVAVYATPASRLDGPVYRQRDRLGTLDRDSGSYLVEDSTQN